MKEPDKPKPPSKLEPMLRVARMQLEEIPDTARAADLCRRILRAQTRTAERQRKEQDNDAA
jgi:hypothetical protein